MKFQILIVVLISFYSGAWAQSPTCLNQNERGCIVSSGDQIARTQEFSLSRQGVLLKDSAEKFTLVKGMAWFEPTKQIRAKTEFGYIEASGSVVVDREESKWVRVVALSEEVYLEIPGWGKVLVPNGFEISFSELQSNGRAKLREFKILTEKEMLTIGYKVGMERSKLVAMLTKLKETKSHRVDSLAEAFKEAGLRKIASEHKKQELKKAEAAKEVQERAMYKAKLRSRMLDLEE